MKKIKITRVVIPKSKAKKYGVAPIYYRATLGSKGRKSIGVGSTRKSAMNMAIRYVIKKVQ